MQYKLKIRPRAEKELQKINKPEYYRILSVLTLLCEDPFRGKKLKGDFSGYYSYRVWPYRIIYQIFQKELLIFFIRIGHRQGVYKK